MELDVRLPDDLSFSPGSIFLFRCWFVVVSKRQSEESVERGEGVVESIRKACIVSARRGGEREGEEERGAGVQRSLSSKPEARGML